MMQAKKNHCLFYLIIETKDKRDEFSRILFLGDGLFEALLGKNIKEDAKSLSGEVHCSSLK